MGYFVFAQSDLAQSNPAQSNSHPQAVLIAAFRGDAEGLKKIITEDTNRDMRDALGRTALHAAMFQGNTEVVRILIQNGWDINAESTKGGNTPLHDAVMAGNVKAAKVLLEKGADKSIMNKAGFTPMQVAANDGKRDLVLALMDRKKR
ncbi:MAG: ankyrin repeat domain-containing protein [Treponema sp.]|nr:ankyrin repeat domain-containing protein [Treponema sp.]